MNYTVKTYLTALVFTITALPIYSADVIDPKILAESKRLAEEQETKHRIYELSEYEAAVQASLRSAKPKTRAQLEQEEIDLALALSLSQETRPKRDASEELARRLQQEEDKKRKQALEDRKAAQRFQEQYDAEHAQAEYKRREEVERKKKAEHPIKGFATIFHGVHGQEGASCGLHSIDNGNKCYTALRAGKSPDEIRQILMTGLSEAAQTIPAEQRNMLDVLQIQAIGRHTLKMSPACFTFLPNITQSKDELIKPLPQKTATVIVPDGLGDAVQALRTQARASHIFVIGDMKISVDASGNLTGQDGHWIAIVADKKDGIVTFHYMCTGGGKHEGLVNALREIIEHGNYYGMQLSTLLEAYSLATIERAIEGGSYRAAINGLHERVTLARKAGVINDPNFHKQDVIQTLKHIELVAPHAYRKQAAELLRELQ